MFYGVLPNRVWSHIWFCSRSKMDLNICQYCTMLRVQNVKVNKYVKNKIKYLHKTYSSSIEIFCFVCFWCPIVYTYKFWKRSSETIFSLWDNFGTLYYEVVTSPVVLFKFYLDVIGRLIFDFCDKNLFQALFSKIRLGRSRIKVINRVKENFFFCL